MHTEIQTNRLPAGTAFAVGYRMAVALRQKLIFPAIVLLLFVVFQNCMKAYESTNGAPPDGKIIIGAPSFSKIIHDPNLEFNSGASPSRLELDLEAETLILREAGQIKSTCGIDEIRLQTIKQILDGAEICSPPPLPPGSVTCLAIGVPDIELSNLDTVVLLRPVICNTGTFLCGDRDQRLRDLLSDLRSRLPQGCN
jgi:hypothetical protein